MTDKMKRTFLRTCALLTMLVFCAVCYAQSGPGPQRLAPFVKDSDALPHQVFDAGTPGAASTTTATMPAVTGAWNYLHGFVVTCAGGTAPANMAITGLQGGTMNVEVPTAAAGGPPVVAMDMNVPSSAENTAITASMVSGASSACRITLIGSVE